MSGLFSSILTLMNVTMDDWGVYHCNVTYNEVSEGTEVTAESQGAKLYVTGMGSFISIFRGFKTPAEYFITFVSFRQAS